MNILLAEDDGDTGGIVRDRLVVAGHAVTLVGNGDEALRLGSSGSFDIAVLDRILPGLDGLAVLRAWRGAGLALPVLLLTALIGIGDRVEGLDAGADDYLVKPFAVAELLARVAALSRRAAGDQAAKLSAGGVSMDLISREVRRDGRRIRLQRHEFGILEQLMRNAGRPVTREMLLKDVWGYAFDPRTNIVESHLSRMRTKLNEGFRRDPVETLRGVGYRMRADG